MAPGRPDSHERPYKRQRTALSDDRYVELEAVQSAQRRGDALSDPALSAALDKLVASRRDSDSVRKKVEIVLKLAKVSLDSLPKKKTMQVDSPVTRNTLRKVARGVKLDSLFQAEGFEQLSVVCRPPTKVNVVGSFLLGYSSGCMADVAVEMPSDIFQAKDYLNYRYHDKRLVYLIYLARHFVKMEGDKWSVVSLTTSYLNDNTAKPVLCVSHSDTPEIIIRLIPTYAEGVFEKSRLAGNRCNIRPAGSSSVVEDPMKATALYNASIAVDFTLVPSLQMLHAAAAGAPAFADTVLLLSAWCHRHRLRMGNFHMAAVLAGLFSKGIVPPRASREHMLRCALRFIARGILRELEISGLRLCAGMDEGLLKRCEITASDALFIIESKIAAEDPWFGIIPYLFVTARGSKCFPKPLPTLFDGFIRVSRNERATGPNEKDVLVVLNCALVNTGRATRIECLTRDLFGLTLKSEEATLRKVDKRPEGWGTESFKNFWGEKAGLRRFKDGRIVESLIWSGGPETLNDITNYACHRHFGKALAVEVISNLEVTAGCSGLDSTASRAIAVFDELASVLRSLEGLPLSIRAVHATSPHLRRCGAFSIRPDARTRYINPLDIVASFESSSAWPDDPVAISAAKAAFYVALRTTLAGKGVHARATISFVDISLGGFVFRLRIRVDKEKKFLPSHSEQSDMLIWETESRVRHQDKIKYVANPLMGSVARLAKRWLNSHLLLSQMGDRGEELVEVIVASIMSKQQLARRKSTMGYFCQFLHILAEFPWEVCPLAVFLEDPEKTMANNEMHGEEQMRFFGNVQDRYNSQLDGEIFFAVYHAWNRLGDDVETWFSRHHNPEQVIAERIVATAQSSLAFIETHLTAPEQAPSLRTIFATPTNAFDVILKLHNRMTPYGTGKGPFRGHGNPYVGIDPVVRLRNELQKSLGGFALFLIERAGRAEIFVVWRPSAREEVKFSLREAPFRTPEEGKLVACREEMIAEMRRIGHDLIKEVSLPRGI